MNRTKKITPAISEVKTYTPAYKIDGSYYVGGIGGNFIPGPNILDTTAVVSDVRAGEIFHLADGTKAVGTLAESTQPSPTVSINSATGLITASYTPVAGIVADTTAKSGTAQISIDAAKVMYGQTLFGTAGTATYETENPATNGAILSGKVAYVNGSKLTGSLATVVQDAPTVTVGADGTITASHTSTVGYVASAATKTATATLSIDASKVLYGQTVYGVEGTATKETSKPVTAGDMLSGKVAYVNGEKITGTLGTVTQPAPTVTIDSSTGAVTASHTSTAGYVAGAETKTATASVEIPAGKVLAGQTIYGTAGTATNDATATAADIISGKTAYVGGVKLTGTKEEGSAVVAGYFVNTNGVITFQPAEGGTAESVTDIYLPDTGVAEPEYGEAGLADVFKVTQYSAGEDKTKLIVKCGLKLLIGEYQAWKQVDLTKTGTDRVLKYQDFELAWNATNNRWECTDEGFGFYVEDIDTSTAAYRIEEGTKYDDIQRFTGSTVAGTYVKQGSETGFGRVWYCEATGKYVYAVSMGEGRRCTDSDSSGYWAICTSDTFSWNNVKYCNVSESQADPVYSYEWPAYGGVYDLDYVAGSEFYNGVTLKAVRAISLENGSWNFATAEEDVTAKSGLVPAVNSVYVGVNKVLNNLMS